MATRPHRRASVRYATLAVASLLAYGVLPAAGGEAQPQPSVSSVQQKIDDLRLQADRAVEDYDAAGVALVSARSRSTAAAGQLARQQAVTEALRARMGSMAAAAYRTGGVGRFAELVLTGDPTTFLDRAAALEQIARGRSRAVRQFEAAARELAAAEAVARAQLAEQQALEQRMRARRDAIESLLRAEQALLARLQAAERQRLASAASRQQPAPAPQAGTLSSRPAGPQPVIRGSGGAATAVRFAYAQLGKPYRWGAAGPGSYDCSGLTMRAWAAAGVSLPHSSAAQFGSGRHVSSSALQPGDLVFGGHPISHVGIYVGGGLMIHAPHTGDVVRVASAFGYDYVGAVRP